ncbi:hypothetical protein [Algoriphagus vanfongensis]|uniref:hypothetical protein n=1 Tax=Algoriphagus vanfongensis TaxID=426371 RepID=UPI0003F99D26|nr:hypothetical protein [Algoriphagus vanfongensis]
MSSFLDDLLKKVFRGSEQTPINHKENFTFKEEELAESKSWIASDTGRETLELIYRNFHLKRTQIANRPEVHLFQSPYANGFAVSYDEPFTKGSFSALFLAFSERVLDLGYRQVSLDRKLEEVNQQVKATEKFYFKPPLQKTAENELISQLYGNISLEKITIDNQPSYIKFLATVYSDRLFQDALPFDQLIDHLFKSADG